MQTHIITALDFIGVHNSVGYWYVENLSKFDVVYSVTYVELPNQWIATITYM